MMDSGVYLVAEDEPGLAVGRKLLAEFSVLSIHSEKNARGYGDLKKNISSYHKMARNGFPVLLLTDLDADSCPSVKINDWLGCTPSQGFLFRICVREIEAWLLADKVAISAFLKINLTKLHIDPESLNNPKAELIKLAQRAPRKIKLGMTPAGSASIGPYYNELLSEFISNDWSLDRAEKNAPSLKRARQRVREFASLITVT